MIQDHGGLEPEELFRQSDARKDELCMANLRYEDGENGEGIWILPCTERDVSLYRDNTSRGDVLHGWICNDPICTDVKFGSKVAFLTNQHRRPYSQEIASSDEAYEDVKRCVIERQAEG